jgi:hypothetical protein
MNGSFVAGAVTARRGAAGAVAAGFAGRDESCGLAATVDENAKIANTTMKSRRELCMSCLLILSLNAQCAMLINGKFEMLNEQILCLARTFEHLTI